MSQKAPEDRLEAMFELQKKLAGMVDSNRYPGGAEERVSALATAIVHEAVELQRTTNWKWWKTPTEFDKKEAREELIDIWHFVIQASIELDLAPEDIIKEYRRKNEINCKRQTDGY
ncbi:MAG: dUTPase [Nitrosopumilus sp. H8]|nr:MAG: dUTPase [Nitrosopumilus sp. H13]RNJ77952.1 MAG: dUTPase [Nitrosopumilus sp. H8]